VTVTLEDTRIAMRISHHLTLLLKVNQLTGMGNQKEQPVQTTAQLLIYSQMKRSKRFRTSF